MRKLSLLILGIILGAVLMYFYLSTKTEVTMGDNPTAPKGVISVQDAIALDAKWTETRKAAVDSAAGKPDNRSVWYSLQDMRDYLNYAEAQAKDLGYTMDGIRIYMGVYGDKAPVDKAGYSTLFIVPTGPKGISQGSSGPTNMVPPGENDIPGGNPLNDGGGGNPPSANYPQ